MGIVQESIDVTVAAGGLIVCARHVEHADGLVQEQVLVLDRSSVPWFVEELLALFPHGGSRTESPTAPDHITLIPGGDDLEPCVTVLNERDPSVLRGGDSSLTGLRESIANELCRKLGVAAQWAALAERFFLPSDAGVAPVDIGTLSRDEFLAHRERHFGEAWLETLAGKPEEIIAWALTKYLIARPYVPRQLVGAWDRAELTFDGNVTTADPMLRGATRWCVHRHTRREDLIGEELWLDGPDGRLAFRILSPGARLLQLRRRKERVDFTRPAVVRSSTEMSFCCSLSPCPSCGGREKGNLRIFGDGTGWMYCWACPECGYRRAYQFATTGVPYEADVPRCELGVGPSQVITAAEFRAELTRLNALIDSEPERLQPVAWNRSRDAIMRGIIVANELAKLDATDDATRVRLESLLDDYVADGPRIHAMAKTVK